METLANSARLVQNPFKRGIVQQLATSTELFGWLQFITEKSGTYKAIQEGTLPTAKLRRINEGYTHSVGADNPIVEHTTDLGNDTKIDKKILKNQGEEVRLRAMQRNIKALAHKFHAMLVQGSDPTADEPDVRGLQQRLPITSGQSFKNNGTDGALNLKMLDHAIDAVDGEQIIILCRRDLRIGLTHAMTDPLVGGYINRGVDQFGRQITQYGGMPIVAADPIKASDSAITDTETYEGIDNGSDPRTSIYILGLGEDGFKGIQDQAVDSRLIGESQEGPQVLERTDWGVGMVAESKFCMARVWDIDPTKSVVKE